jgi:hypothetical protein
MGHWAKDVCGSSYYFGNTLVNATKNDRNPANHDEKMLKQATWEQNFQTCCSMGLKPIVFETPTEIECLGNYTKSETQALLKLFKSVRQVTGRTISITGPVAPSAIAKDNGRGALAQKKWNFIIKV